MATPPAGAIDNLVLDAKPGEVLRVFLAKDSEGGYAPLFPNGVQAVRPTK